MNTASFPVDKKKWKSRTREDEGYTRIYIMHVKKLANESTARPYFHTRYHVCRSMGIARDLGGLTTVSHDLSCQMPPLCRTRAGNFSSCPKSQTHKRRKNGGFIRYGTTPTTRISNTRQTHLRRVKKDTVSSGTRHSASSAVDTLSDRHGCA